MDIVFYAAGCVILGGVILGSLLLLVQVIRNRITKHFHDIG